MEEPSARPLSQLQGVLGRIDPREVESSLDAHTVSTAPGQRAEEMTSGQALRTGRGRGVFVDRDGVINRNRQDYVKSWDEFQFLDGAREALARLAQTDFKIVIASNQSAIGRGLVAHEGVQEIHRRMVQQIEQAGGRVNYIAYCPHRPDENCACRKPSPGLLIEASRELDLDLTCSYLIGDSLGDIQAGSAVGCVTVLVRTGLGEQTLALLPELDGPRPMVVDDLVAAVEWIIDREGVPGEPERATPAG